MSYEVEQKFPIVDPAAFERKLADYGARFGSPQRQADRYFAHPARDFRQTGEALRIRSAGDENFITYKGPRLDRETKTRLELELPVAPGEEAAELFYKLLETLGFRPVETVVKERRCADFEYEGFFFQATIDRVEHLGDYVELEVIADEDDLAVAQTVLKNLTARLRLGPMEPRSYLTMLLERLGAEGEKAT